jgi:DNA-binding transcriptional LysR family regulator
VRHEAGSVELMKGMVLRGLGVAFMTHVGLETELEAGRLIHVPLRQGKEAVRSTLGLYARTGTAMPAAAAAFAGQLAEAMARLHGPAD